jgi:hypothetical protein
MDLFKPRAAGAPRNPITDNQQNGVVTNTPRFAHLGGLSNASKAGPKNKMHVEKPGDGKRVI